MKRLPKNSREEKCQSPTTERPRNELNVNQPRKVCAIVDAYSSSNLYAPALKAKGYECIAIRSQATPTSLIAGSLRSEDFTEILTFTGNVDEMVSELKKRNVELVVPGMEMGIELADTLGERMASPFFNQPKTSHLRRNKFDMIEAIRERGLKAANQIKASDLDQILSWSKKANSWPLVIKPADSGGADRVSLCHDDDELKAAFQASIGSLGRQGRVIQEVVVQEFMRGTEYIVDTVSHQGHHMIVNIWRYNRVAVNGAQFVYDTKELVPYEGEAQEQLITYTRKSLDAVGLQHGPSHNELMMTADGPMLVEINARFGGSMAPILNRECVGRGQLDVMMDVLFAPEKFLAYCREPYQIKMHGLAVYLISKNEGCMINSNVIGQIESLPSRYRLSLATGTKLAKTVDMFTMPGMVELVHEDSDQIWEDYARVRELEASGNFYIKSAP